MVSNVEKAWHHIVEIILRGQKMEKIINISTKELQWHTIIVKVRWWAEHGKSEQGKG